MATTNETLYTLVDPPYVYITDGDPDYVTVGAYYFYNGDTVSYLGKTWYAIVENDGLDSYNYVDSKTVGATNVNVITDEMNECGIANVVNSAGSGTVRKYLDSVLGISTIKEAITLGVGSNAMPIVLGTNYSKTVTTNAASVKFYTDSNNDYSIILYDALRPAFKFIKPDILYTFTFLSNAVAGNAQYVKFKLIATYGELNVLTGGITVKTTKYGVCARTGAVTTWSTSSGSFIGANALSTFAALFTIPSTSESTSSIPYILYQVKLIPYGCNTAAGTYSNLSSTAYRFSTLSLTFTDTTYENLNKCIMFLEVPGTCCTVNTNASYSTVLDVKYAHLVRHTTTHAQGYANSTPVTPTTTYTILVADYYNSRRSATVTIKSSSTATISTITKTTGGSYVTTDHDAFLYNFGTVSTPVATNLIEANSTISLSGYSCKVVGNYIMFRPSTLTPLNIVPMTRFVCTGMSLTIMNSIEFFILSRFTAGTMTVEVQNTMGSSWAVLKTDTTGTFAGSTYYGVLLKDNTQLMHKTTDPEPDEFWYPDQVVSTAYQKMATTLFNGELPRVSGKACRCTSVTFDGLSKSSNTIYMYSTINLLLYDD